MKKALIFLIIIFSVCDLKADSWKLPENKNYTSENGEYILTVYPTQIPQKYFSWLNAKPKKKSKFLPSDTIIIPCNATLKKIENNDTIEVWSRKLVNRVAPVHVIVANNGEFVVTFDNWGNLGYGIDVMVCYDKNGNLIKQFSLEDISPFPIDDYMFSISSIWWCCGVEFISNNKIKICFEDESKNVKELMYYIDKNEFKE